MKGKVAVEQNLSPVSDYLTRQGYTVENMKAGDMLIKSDYDAYVLSGMTENVFGYQDRASKARVINAKGLTPEDVARQLESR